MSVVDTDSTLAWRIQVAHLRQELLSPVNALLGYAEIMHEEASGAGRPDILPDMNRILGAQARRQNNPCRRNADCRPPRPPDQFEIGFHACQQQQHQYSEIGYRLEHRPLSASGRKKRLLPPRRL